MNEEDIVCELHEKEATAIICMHLCSIGDGDGDCNIGFNVPADIKNDLQAWCDQCEKILIEAGEWTEAAAKLADLRPCCVGCFISIKKRCGF